MKNTRFFSQLFAIAIALLMAPKPSSADIGLLVYDAFLVDPYLTSAGHAGVYLSNVCMADEANKVRICTAEDQTNQNAGVIIQRYSDIAPGSTQDWIVLPTNINLYGTANKGDAPLISSPQTLNILRTDAYNNSDLHINQDFKPVQSKGETAPPAIADGNWQYAIGMSEIRSAHLMTMATTPEEDQRVVDWLNNDDNVSHFSNLFNNCANFANTLFKVAKGPSFDGRGELEDFFLVTPLADAKAFKKIADKNDAPYTMTVINQSAGTFKRSSTPTEMSTFSNSQFLISLPLHMLPYAGLINLGLKYFRRLGGPLPGYRAYLDIDGKEVKEHGTPELAETNYELANAKKAHDDAQAQELQQKMTTLQSDTFGTKACWKSQQSKFSDILSNAISADIVDSSYQPLFKFHDLKDDILRLIPLARIKPTQSKLLNQVVSGAGTQVEQNNDGIVLVKNGVTAGLTRDNVTKYDQKLGFLIVASELDYTLAEPSNRLPQVPDFDSDWSLMLQVAQSAGLTISDGDKQGLAACIAQSAAATAAPQAN